MSGCGTVVRNRIVGMIRGTGVPSGGGVVVMGTIGVTILHPREIGKLELPPLLEVVSPSLVDSSRMVSSDDGPLGTIPINTSLESLPSRERIRLPKRSVMNSKLPKRMVSPRVNATPVLW
jgi:hypothetical protein